METVILLASFKLLIPRNPIAPVWSRCGGCRCFPFPPHILSFSETTFRCKVGSGALSSNFSRLQGKACTVNKPARNSEEEGDVDDDDDDAVDYQMVMALRSSYNDIVILDTPESRMLLLDSTHNVHSIFNSNGQKWTDSYWDEFASLPAIVPNGSIAIFGLGGGTAAHLMLDLWPSLQLQGWEIDEILIDKAREFLGLSDLEKHNGAAGILNVHVGDALSSSTAVPRGYAGIVIDLFSDGKVLPQLQEVETWLELNDKLMPNGRIMVNCGVADDRGSSTHPLGISSTDSTWEQNSTIKALCKAFPGQVSWKKMPKGAGENYMALTGPFPDLNTWSAALPQRLSSGVKQWRRCGPL